MEYTFMNNRDNVAVMLTADDDDEAWDRLKSVVKHPKLGEFDISERIK